MSRKILGLDIRSNSVAAVILNSGIKEEEIEDFCFFSWDGKPEEEEGESAEAQALRQLSEALDLSEVECAVSFPAEHAFYRNLRVPFKESRKIKQVLPFEIEPTLPLAVDQVAIDFQKVARSGQQEQTGIFAAVVEKSRLDKMLTDLKSIGLNPGAATISGYATTIMTLRQTGTTASCLVIDVYRHQAAFFAVASGQIQTVRSTVLHPIDSDPATSLGRGIIQTVSATEDILGIEFSPESIYINGIETGSSEIQQQIFEKFEIPVHVIDLAQDTGIRLRQNPEKAWIPHQMNNALSLAAEESAGGLGLNFHRRQFAAKKHWITYRNDILNTGILASIILFFLLFSLVYDFYSTGRAIRGVDAQIATIYKRVFPQSAIEDPFVQQRQLQAKVDEMKNQSMTAGDAGGANRSIDIINDISRLLPKELDIELNRLVIGPDMVTIAGDTATFNSVDEMKNRLEKGALFEKVTISSANSDSTGKRITFKLKLDL